MHTLAVDQGWSAAVGLVTAGVLLGVLALRRLRPVVLGPGGGRTATGLLVALAALLLVHGVAGTWIAGGLPFTPAPRLAEHGVGAPHVVPPPLSGGPLPATLGAVEAGLVVLVLALGMVAVHGYRARPASALVPWLAALAVATAVRYATGPAPSLDPVRAVLVGPLVAGGAAVPAAVACLHLLHVTRSAPRPSTSVPWTARVLVAGWAVGLAGAALGHLVPGRAGVLVVALWPVALAVALVARALHQGRRVQDEADRALHHRAVREALLGGGEEDVDAVVARATALVRDVLRRTDVEVRLHLLPHDRAQAHVAVAPGAPPLDAHAAAFGTEVGLVVGALAERRWLRERLDRTVRTDPLTGLANRMALDARLDAGADDALLLVDVDSFRAVNDVHGHATGDAVLRDVARHLQRAAGEAFVARLGADQFVVLAGAGLEAAETMAALARRVAGSVPSTTGVAVRLCAGLGARAADERRPVPLLQRAEAALEEARLTGAGWLPFDAAMEERRAGEHRRRAAMLAGVADQRFVAHLQPIVDARTLEVVGVEALARWDRAGEILPPGAWLPLAEESGLIVPIGADMLRQAGLVHDRYGLAVSVNVAPQQLTDPAFVATVEDAWGRRPWSALTLEITEGALLVTEEVLPALVALRERGARISLDDFGTGFSSLARLVDLPVDELKIDRSFVLALDTERGRAVLAAVVELARAHGLDVVAEGVETPEQLATLTGLGVDHLQGYLLGRPAPEPPAQRVVELPEPHRRRWAAHVRAEAGARADGRPEVPADLRAAASASAPTGVPAAR